jgi:excisionase family DNA binding protein
LKQKARRGELFMTVAIGYVRIGNNSIAKDPDRRIAEAITLVFAKFTEMQSVRQVHLWLRHERIPLPAVAYGAEGRRIEWKLPVYNTVLHILTNPIYAGAYAFGRTGSRVSIEAGRKKVVRGFKKERNDWEVLIPNHHEGYLSWADYERNLSLIADNANGKNPMSRGALRRGEALLAGLLRCGHCGRKLHVAYSGKDGNTGRYHCQGGFINHGGDRCISFGGMRIDREVGTEVMERLQPLGIEAALAAQAVRSRASEDKRRQVELALEQARYEVGHARRQYDAVDPDNRLVAAELEKRWNERLAIIRDLETALEGLAASPATELTPADRERLMTLGADLQLAWTKPGVTPEVRKRIVRTVIDEIIVDVEENVLNLVIRWHGGDHSTLKVRKNRTGQHRWSAAAETVDLVRILARQMPDKAIASVLNRAGKTTGRGNGWTQSRVCSLRSHNAIATYREGERRERGEVTLDEAAAALSVSPSTVRRLIKDGQLLANQFCKGAPWIIKAADLERADVKSAATARRLRRPPSGDPLQKVLEL